MSVSPSDRAVIKRDGQARLDWDGSYLDIFFATFELHREMAERSRQVSFGPVQIPILSPEHLTVCKAVFDRPKDWLDIEETIAWGTTIDTSEVLGWVRQILGEDSEQYTRMAALLDHTDTARGRARETIFESERQAIRADAQNPAVLEEMHLWETTLADGID